MQNPKTTIVGYLTLAAAVLTLFLHVLGGGFGITDLSTIAAAMAGIGLVSASDGGH